MQRASSILRLSPCRLSIGRSFDERYSKGEYMGEGSGWARYHLSRRDFLRYSLATGAVVWAGSQVPRGLIGAAEAEKLFGAADFTPPNLKFFPQSVASGDPAPEGIVLWTRALPAPRDRDGSVRVGYRIALDDERSDTDAFSSPVLSGVAQTSPGRDFTVKVQVRNERLRPGTKYRYRFYIDGKRSRSGRFKTLPEPDADVGSARFGYISCQDYTNGYYTALYHLQREDDLDFIVHLGDYIYETVAEGNFQGGGPEERQIDPAKLGSGTNGEADTLADYRFLYRKYKTDPNLQALHEKYALITIWDDHEFANDGYRSFAPDSADSPRRADAASRRDARRRFIVPACRARRRAAERSSCRGRTRPWSRPPGPARPSLPGCSGRAPRPCPEAGAPFRGSLRRAPRRASARPAGKAACLWSRCSFHPWSEVPLVLQGQASDCICSSCPGR